MCLVSFAKNAHYSALKKLKEKPLPAWAYIVICDDCSHKCSWCYGGFNQELSHTMSFEEFKIVLSKLKEMGTFQVSLAGGEPTEHPDFKSFVRYASAQGFLVHVVSHGEHIDLEMARFLKAQNIDQVQINWQGQRNHDRIHGVPGAHQKASAALALLAQAGVETTATITVGKYNLPYIDEIMQEAAAFNVTRLRVWETTGHGVPFLKGLEAGAIFDRCREAAAKLGYTHCLSYDPVYEGDVTVPCLQFSNLFMYIDSYGKLNFCGAVPEIRQLGDFLDPDLSGEEIRRLYLRKNEEILRGKPIYCASREGFKDTNSIGTPVKWHNQPITHDL